MATTTNFTGNCTATDSSSIVLTPVPLDVKSNAETTDPITSVVYTLDSTSIVTGVPAANTLTCTFTPTGKLGVATVTVTATSQSGATAKTTGTITVTATGVMSGLQLNWTVTG